jgi:hypothetical protein
MAWYEHIFGAPKKIEMLNVEGASLPEDSKPISERSTDTISDPVDFETLEKLYRRDSDTFAAINHIIKTFMSSQYIVTSDDKKSTTWTDAFLYNNRFDIILRKIILHCCIFGNAWVELVSNSKGKLVAFDHVNPKVMDFARDSSGNIIYDKYNNPAYYVQVLPMGSRVPPEKESRVVEQPASPQIPGSSGTGIRFETDEIAHFTLWTVGDSLNGIGLIEPMWNALMAKIQIEKDWGIAMKKATSPLLVGTVGDDMHPANQTAIDKMTRLLVDATSQSIMALPHPNRAEYVTANIQSLEPHLSYYVDKVSAATGVPKPYIVGSGDSTPRSTFKGLNLGYERNIMEMQKNIAYAVEKQIFPRLVADYNLISKPLLKFESPSIEYLDAKTSRLVDYSNAGLLIPDESIRQIVRRLENLPPEPPGLEAEYRKKMEKTSEEAVDEKEDEEEEVKKDGK